MIQLPLKAVAPIISVLLFVLPVNAAPITATAEANGWEHDIDTDRPVLNASVYDGSLSIEVVDEGSGIRTIFVNGYEFTDMEDGRLDIRLSRFDSAYEFFTVSALDDAGNMSAIYRIRNPYYEDPDAEDSDEHPSELLPIEAGPTDPVDATAVVTEYDTTNEFYTITASSGKVFYLIIDKSEDQQTVYFLTEISENDLLNVTSDTEETLPRNTAVADSAIPVEAAIPVQSPQQNVETNENPDREDKGAKEDDGKGIDIAETVEVIKQNPMAGYICIGAVALIFFIIAYYFKVVKKNQDGGFVDDEEDEDDEYERYGNETLVNGQTQSASSDDETDST